MKRRYLIGYEEEVGKPDSFKRIRVPTDSIGNIVGGSGPIVSQKIISQVNINQGFFPLSQFPKSVDMPSSDELTNAMVATVGGGLTLVYGHDYWVDITKETPRFVWGSNHPASSYTELYPLSGVIRVGDVIMVIYR